MSGVRVLVGTRKGAFVMTADGKRDRWDISGPHFGGWEIYHLKGSPAEPNRLYASQSSGWFGQVLQRSNDGGQTWEPVDNQFVYDGVPGTHQWYDGTPHPWEFKRVWHLEPSLTDPDTVYAGVEDAALFRSTDGGQSWQELSGLRGHGSGSALAAGRGWIVPAHDRAGSERPGADLHRHLGGGRVPDRRRRPDLAADQPWTEVRRHSRPECRSRPLRAPHRDAPVAARRAVHAKALGRHAHRRRRRILARDQRQPADRLRVCARRARARGRHRLRRSDQERFGALSARGKAARLPQPYRRKRVGGAHERSASARLLRQCVARRDGHRLARFVRRVFRHHRRAGVRVGRRRRPGPRSSAICPPVLSVEVQTLS